MTLNFICQLSANLSNLFICSVPKAELSAHRLLVETLKCIFKSCLNHKMLLLITHFQCQATLLDFTKHPNSLYYRQRHKQQQIVLLLLSFKLICKFRINWTWTHCNFTTVIYGIFLAQCKLKWEEPLCLHWEHWTSTRTGKRIQFLKRQEETALICFPANTWFKDLFNYVIFF